MEDEIKQNLVFLTENLTNITGILTYMTQKDIISTAESEDIDAESTPTRKNFKLLSTLQRKDWREIRNSFLEILRKTNNDHCAQAIQGRSVKDSHCPSSTLTLSMQTKNYLLHPQINKKWWPEKKLLIKSLLKRKRGEKYLIEELQDRMSRDENRMVVIYESAAASKYSGMGGVGKTITAKWYAYTYEQQYDHIIWIDCGEGSLITSFESLARDLKIEHLDKLNLSAMTIKCFDALSEFKCLWIYDNAENYKGEEGIINVLPKHEMNFYCVITSRSREWGTEKIGYGKITDLELDIFSEEESLEFLKSTLQDSIEQTDAQLKELCRLMGNLPLALQLAVAALNNGKIELQNYIEKTSSNDLGIILDEKFDDYEKTINQCIRISLDVILHQENGKLAYEMLMVFGYIRPDDVQSIFLMKILNTKLSRFEVVVNLLEKYALITKTGKAWESTNENRFFNKLLRKDEIKVEMYLLSIHRLLQQVIRHNGCETEKETLTKILGCEGFIDYKLIPFTKYADEKMQKAFSKVRAELLDRRQLRKLINDQRFEEAVQLAKFIYGELKTNTAKFNYAVCLAKNGQDEESEITLEELEREELTQKRMYSKYSLQMGLLKLKEELSKDLVQILLFVIRWRIEEKKLEEGEKMKKCFKIIYSKEALGTLIQIVHSDLINSSYLLLKGFDSTIKLFLERKSSEINLRNCSLDLSSFDRLSAEVLKLRNVSFTRNEQRLEKIIFNEILDLDKIKILSLSGGSLDLTDDISIYFVYLWEVRVVHWSEAKWNVGTLELDEVPLVEKTKMRIIELKLCGSSLDVSCLPRSIEKLHLCRAKVVCRGLMDIPNLKYLTLESMTTSFLLSLFRFSNVTHIHFCWMKAVNVDHLPESITQIKITNYSTIVVGSLTKLDKLILELFSYKQVEELLGHFETDNLVVYYKYDITPNEFMDLAKKAIKRIAVGRVNSGKDFSVLSSHVDRKASYYLWEGGRGTGIEKNGFMELKTLY